MAQYVNQYKEKYIKISNWLAYGRNINFFYFTKICIQSKDDIPISFQIWTPFPKVTGSGDILVKILGWGSPCHDSYFQSFHCNYPINS